MALYKCLITLTLTGKQLIHYRNNRNVNKIQLKASDHLIMF